MKSFNLALNKLSLKNNSAFTIVELLIVIVVIGILASITIVSFSGITNQANQASLQSDLNSNSRKLELYFTQYGSYPTALDGNNCPSAPTVDTNYCLKLSSGTSLTSYSGSSSTFTLKASKGSLAYQISPRSAPIVATLTCPSGFIVVPGSATYGTSDFCVMKYEAKCANNSALSTGITTSANVYDNSATECTALTSRSIVSVASGNPIVYLSQSTAANYASLTSGCTGCKLITEAEWMTIAQNVLSNPVNWSGGAVGSGYIFSGNNDGTPANSLAASTDNDGYFGTSNASGNQKRTLTLTNGEVIWDFAGNVYEWTAGQITGGQPSGAGFLLRDWTQVSGGTFSVNPYPSSTGLSGSSTWNSSNGIGLIYSSSTDSTLRGFNRSGAYDANTTAGVLTLYLSFAPTYGFTNLGFRATK